MIELILLPALFGGLGLSFCLGGLGVFVIWQRLSFLGDVLAHASLLGLALSVLMNWAPLWGILLVALALGFILAQSLTHSRWAQETLLALLSYGGLAFALLIIGLTPAGPQILTRYLFGDILAITFVEICLIWTMVAAVLIFLKWKWRALLSLTIAPEVAFAEGINVHGLRRLFIIFTALVIALALKFVGALLVVALLVVPAAAATSAFRTPFWAVAGSVLIGALCVTTGIGVSVFWDVPIAPLIASTAFAILILLKVLCVWRDSNPRP
ncbi:MAG: zinc ABC transporter permease subunit ZnuB [bacterium]|nr:zinc ABC transporter permease subunit ZnuB [bacterium]